MKITLKDIAIRTGYSINTVSHALAGKTDISAATREEICRIADEMGYIRNTAASGLRSGKSRAIALILPDVANPNFIIMFRGIEAFFREKSYTVFVLNTDEDPKLERDAIRAALAQNADGIILCPTPGDEKDLAYLQSTDVPFCLIGRQASVETDFVTCDDALGGYLAAKHLLDAGHRRLAFFNGDSRISTARERLAGIERACREQGVALPKEHQLTLSVKTGGSNRAQMRQFLQEHPGVTALIAFSDLLAFEAISVLEEMGRTVPQDLSVVGFDNICSDFSFSPALSSVSVSKKTMAAAAAELLWSKIQGNTPCERQIVLPTKLIQRRTVKTLKE